MRLASAALLVVVGGADEEVRPAHGSLSLGDELGLDAAGARVAPRNGAGFLDRRQARVAAARLLDHDGAAPPKDTPGLLPGVADPVLLVIAGGERVVRDPASAQALAEGAKPGSQPVTVADADRSLHDRYAEEPADAVADSIETL